MFLSASAAAVLGPGLYRYWQSRFAYPTARLMGPASHLGHILRDPTALPEPTSEHHVPLLIVGGGASGLSAAWRLKKKGFTDFQLLELDREVGGNAAWGENKISPYPWGAHYVPVPGPDSHLVRELLHDFGVIKGFNHKGQPIYDERYVCDDPEERLWIHGRWQEGIVPKAGLSSQESEEIQAFFQLMNSYRDQRGRDGRPAFAIPLETSSRDPEFVQLDSMTMESFLHAHGWRSKPLHWYINYCCRDDFGTLSSEISAWAGVHYFAARGGDPADLDSHSVLTWPEGNGWLIKRLRESVRANIQTSALVTAIRPVADGVEADVYYPDEHVSKRWTAKSLILATPRFVAGRLIEEWRRTPPAHLRAFEYAPWMVANITLQGLPASRAREFPLAWDNVSYESDSLGYVVATHQTMTRYQPATVLTLYWPLTAAGSPSDARRSAHTRRLEEWNELVVADLERLHPGIRQQIRNVDIWLWGHGMIRPTTGFIWGDARREALQPLGRIHFAHSDLSGISIFEEAQYRGVTAADQALAHVRT